MQVHIAASAYLEHLQLSQRQHDEEGLLELCLRRREEVSHFLVVQITF